LHVAGACGREGAGGGDYMLGGMDTEMSWEAVNEAGGAEAARESARDADAGGGGAEASA
jgi:hypothetical protein